jgi:hypothetical protein
VSEQPESPATPGDEPAALVPDDATAVHPTGGEPTGTEPALGAAPANEPSGDTGSPIPSVLPDPIVPAAATPDAPAWTPPAAPQESSGGSGSGPAAVATDRPEVAVGAAFAGGLVLALILKRLAR